MVEGEYEIFGRRIRRADRHRRRPGRRPPHRRRVRWRHGLRRRRARPRLQSGRRRVSARVHGTLEHRLPGPGARDPRQRVDAATASPWVPTTFGISFQGPRQPRPRGLRRRAAGRGVRPRPRALPRRLERGRRRRRPGRQRARDPRPLRLRDRQPAGKPVPHQPVSAPTGTATWTRPSRTWLPGECPARSSWVWQGTDEDQVEEASEIHAERLRASDGATLSSTQISTMGGAGDLLPQRAPTARRGEPDRWNAPRRLGRGRRPTRASRTTSSKIFGQHLDTDGSEIGDDDFRVSAMGPDGNASYDAERASLAISTATGSPLVVWRGDDSAPLVDDELEIWANLLDGGLIFADGFESGTTAPGAAPRRPDQRSVESAVRRRVGRDRRRRRRDRPPRAGECPLADPRRAARDH